MSERLKIVQVKNFIENNTGYKLISDFYLNSSTKLKIMCPVGHIFEKKYMNFYQGQRCPICKKWKTKKKTYKEIKVFIEKHNYKLLSETYENSRTKIKLLCPNEHKYETKFNDFYNGHRCPTCFGNIKYTQSYVFDLLNKENYTLLDDYKNNHSSIKVVCDKNHNYYTTLKRFKNGHRCPKCFMNGQISRSEKRILDIVKNIYNGKIKENDRTVIRNPFTNRYLELDIWLPEINKAIEYNGIYYHQSKDVMQRDQIKLSECLKSNVDLLVLKDINWKNDYNKVENIIKNFVGEN